MSAAGFFAFAGIFVLAAGCAAPRSPACASGEQAMVSEMFYFGTNKPTGVVTADDWQAFLNEVVTPRFPQGLSVWRASGQWKSGAGPIVREGSYVLNIVHSGDSSEDQALNEIAGAYKAEFQQESVLRVRGGVCASF